MRVAESLGWLLRWCFEDVKDPPPGMPEFELRILSIVINMIEKCDQPRICRPLVQLALNPFVQKAKRTNDES
jgi:hypothetical protein